MLTQVMGSLAALLPIAIILCAATVVVVISAGGKLTADDISEITMSVLTILFGVWLVLILVASICMNIHPTEGFVDLCDNMIWTEIADAEKDVCIFIDRTDKFIQSNVGKPGVDDPPKVAAAQQDARTAAGGPLTDCQAKWALVEPNISDATDRISRLETTLKGLCGPIFLQAFNSSDTCSHTEGFANYEETDLRKRLTAIEQMITEYKQKYLKPIDDKQAALNRGEVSDCDKSRGGKAGANIAANKPV